MRPGVLCWLFLGVVCMIGPGLGAVGSTVCGSVVILFRMSFWNAGPGGIFFVSWPVTDTFEAGSVSDWRRWWWRRFIPLVEREAETVESDTFAVSEKKVRHFN